jgi:hypothetical protein
MSTLLELMPAIDDAIQLASNVEKPEQVQIFADIYNDLDSDRCGKSNLSKPSLEQLLLRSIIALEECQSDMNEEAKMGKVFESISEDLASMNKSWNDIHELLEITLMEVSA